MPYTVFGDMPTDITLGGTIEYDYQYPQQLSLRPGTKLHDDLRTRLMFMAREGYNVVKDRHSDWTNIDNKLTAYIPTSAKEKKIVERDVRKPVSIVFPYSYAILETLLSYMVAAFLPEPIFRYEGVSPEDTVGAQLMEKVINLHCNKTKVGLSLHTWFRDAGAYGFGAVSPQWDVQFGKRSVAVEGGQYDDYGNFTSGDLGRERVDSVLFEGNSLQNIDPYRYIPDPNVPIQDVQKGEFVGWTSTDNYLNLLEAEESDEDLFNVKYLQHVQNTQSILTPARSRTRERNQSMAQVRLREVDLLHIYVKLVPAQWKLGDEDSPKKWLFTIGNDSVILRAKQLDFDHNQFPVAIISPDCDGYSPIAYSRMEILHGMQVIIDFMFNSHVANVRRSINNITIVDPYLLNMEDLKNADDGGIVRLRKPAWGRGVERAAMQLPVNDVTKGNIQDVLFIIQYMQQIAGTDNAMMGALRRGGPDRLSAKEFQGTAQGAVSRLERFARMVGLQGMSDVGGMFAYHTQQFMSQDVYIKTSGDWPDSLLKEIGTRNGRAKVTPYQILVAYDLLIRDGSVPGGNFSDSWIQLFQTISGNEALLQRFDIVRLFKYIAMQLGAKNVDDFELRTAPQIQPTVAPDEEVERAVQNGDLVDVLAGVA